jgi:hypothetical protein
MILKKIPKKKFKKLARIGYNMKGCLRFSTFIFWRDILKGCTIQGVNQIDLLLHLASLHFMWLESWNFRSIYAIQFNRLASRMANFVLRHSCHDAIRTESTTAMHIEWKDVQQSPWIVRSLLSAPVISSSIRPLVRATVIPWLGVDHDLAVRNGDNAVQDDSCVYYGYD